MKKLAFLIINLIFLKTVYAQYIYHGEIRTPDRDFHRYKKREGETFKKIETYNCTGFNLSNDSCKCVQSREYSDEGHLLKMTSGIDIKRDSIEYIINTLKYSDSSSFLNIELRQGYFEKNIIFVYSDEYEVTRLNSLISHDNFDTLPSKVIHLDTTGKELGIYYPRAKKKSLGRIDTLLSEFGKVISSEDDDECQILKYNKEDSLIEAIFIDEDLHRGPWFYRSTLLYDSAKKLSIVIIRNKANDIIGINRTYYNNNKVTKTTFYCDSTEQNCLEENYFDLEGNLIETKGGTYSVKNIYNNKLLSKTLYFESGLLKNSTIYKYD